MKRLTCLELVAILALGSTALPAGALGATLTVRDIELAGDGYKLTIPSIEATDANLDEAAVRALFTSGVENAAATLSTLDAAKIVIPEATVTAAGSSIASAAGKDVSTTYRDFEMGNVTDGVAHDVKLGGVEVKSVDGSTFTVGAVSASLLDLGAVAGFYGLGATDTAMRPLYQNFAIDGMRLSATGVDCAIGRMAAEESQSRPLKVKFGDLMAVTQQLQAAEARNEDPSREAISTLIAYYIDLFTAFRSTPSQVDGFRCDGKDDKGAPVHVSAGPMTIGGFEPGIYPELALNDLRIEIGGEGAIALQNFTWKPMDLSAPIAALGGGQSFDPQWFEDNWRKVIPAIEGFSVTGLDVDVPDTENAGQRVKAEIGDVDLTLSDYRDGIPATVAASGTGIKVAVPEGADGAPLRAMGIDVLDLGYDLAAHWDEASKTIAIKNLAVRGTGLGALSVSGTIGNAGPLLFSPDPKVAEVAALALTVRELNIVIENNGLAPTIVAAAAAEQKVPPQQFLLQMSGLAQALPLAVLGATPEALGLSRALGDFLTGAPKLRVTLTASDPAGVGLADLMAAQKDPTVLKGKVKISAEASGEKVPFTFPAIEDIQPPADRKVGKGLGRTTTSS